MGEGMTKYSVMVTIESPSRTYIEHQLRRAFGDTVVKSAQIAKSEAMTICHEACRNSDHFGCVHWTEQDLRGKLKERGVPITSDVLDALRATYALRHIDDRMIESGWNAIEQAIEDAGLS